MKRILKVYENIAKTNLKNHRILYNGGIPSAIAWVVPHKDGPDKFHLISTNGHILLDTVASTTELDKLLPDQMREQQTTLLQEHQVLSIDKLGFLTPLSDYNDIPPNLEGVMPKGLEAVNIQPCFDLDYLEVIHKLCKVAKKVTPPQWFATRLTHAEYDPQIHGTVDKYAQYLRNFYTEVRTGAHLTEFEGGGFEFRVLLMPVKVREENPDEDRGHLYDHLYDNWGFRGLQKGIESFKEAK